MGKGRERKKEEEIKREWGGEGRGGRKKGSWERGGGEKGREEERG